jgi:CRP-like cAMP-binding protein
MRGVSLAALLLAPLLSLAAEELKVSPEQVKALGIETASVSTQAKAEITGLPALVVVPNEQLQVVAAPLAGLVERVLVAAHEPVKKGQVLARLQSPELADLQHTYLQAATQASLARSTLERDEALYRDGIIAESRYLASRSHAVETAADLAERTQALRLAGMSAEAIARLRAGQRVGTLVELVSPLDGVVLEQLAVAGQRLEAAAPVFRVARLAPLWLEIQLPVARLGEVRERAAVSVPAAPASGEVIAVGRSVSSGNQTVLVRARVDGGAERLRPGQYVEASIAALTRDARFSVPAGAVGLFRQGEPSTGVHAVVHGRVALTVHGPRGRERVSDIIGAGRSFGEAIMFLEKPYIVSAQALTDALVLHVARETIFAELERNPRFARRIIATLSAKLEATVRELDSYALGSASRRFAAWLLRASRAGDSGSATLALPASKKAVASKLNLSAEHLSRILRELADEGLIEVAGRTVAIADVARLRRWSEQAGENLAGIKFSSGG